MCKLPCRHRAGHAAPNALAVQPGGADLLDQGLRASQPLRYIATNTAFRFDDEGKASVVVKIAKAAWAGDFKAVYGKGILNDPDLAFEKLTLALQAFQRDDVAFNGFSSKYDSVLAGKAELTAQEARGLALFNDAAKGNCAACHPSEK